MVNGKNNLPANWKLVQLDRVTDVNPKLDKTLFDDDLDVSFVPMPAVEAESGAIDVSEIKPFSSVKKGYTAFREGDVLFAKITPCMENGKMAIAPDLKNGLGFGSTEFHVLRTCLGVSPKYIYYLVSQKLFRIEAEHNMTGAVGQRRVPAPWLSKVSIPLPPEKEQERIVKKIEALFSELDKGIESLKTAREQLKVYRQSLLKHAFEGKLTEQWRADNPEKLETADELLARIQKEREARYQQQLADWEVAIDEWKGLGSAGKRPKKPRLLNKCCPVSSKEKESLGVLPGEWSWIHFSSICEFENGDRGKSYPNKSEYKSSGVPWINTGHINPDGSLSEERMHYISREKFDTLGGGKIKQGDLVYCLRGATFGKTAFVDPLEEGAIASSLMIIRPFMKRMGNYIFSYLVGPMGKQQLERFDNGTAQPNLSASSVGMYLFPLPPLLEQKEISRVLDLRIQVIQRLEADIRSSLSKSEALRQSILKKAFSGQLIPQDPNDEPASELLKRIAEEKAQIEAAAKAVKAATKKTRAKKTARTVSTKKSNTKPSKSKEQV